MESSIKNILTKKTLVNTIIIKGIIPTIKISKSQLKEEGLSKLFCKL